MFNHTTLANRRPLSSPTADATFSSRPITTQHQNNHQHHLHQELLVTITLISRTITISVRDQAVQEHEPYLVKLTSQAAEQLATRSPFLHCLKAKFKTQRATLCPPLPTSVSIIVKKKVTILKNRQGLLLASVVWLNIV